jgi:hypothetical protein
MSEEKKKVVAKQKARISSIDILENEKRKRRLRDVEK